ncbi:hypothetical protein D6779_11690 [Candidatus Parcubacteria bacterium]|nr:MAG: hypothetical protein D6779_11690 [Candidatus Parcubacteria bacterium]
MDLIITAFFELMVLLAIVGTFREWQKSKRNWELLPILAYVFAMLSFLGPYREEALHPWFAGLIWVGVGIVIRRVVRRKPTT